MRGQSSNFACSFTGATAADCSASKPRISLAELLDEDELPSGTWYCSWITEEPAELMERLFADLPCCHPPCLAHAEVKHERALWWFVGRNSSGSDTLAGRPEHVDQVVHDGTWHYQLAGAKEWTLRPTKELVAAHFQGRPSGSVKVRCEQGDVLLLSTKEWWHGTAIPPLKGRLTCSFAREFNFTHERLRVKAGADAFDEEDDEDVPCGRALFAEAAFAAGAIILSEDALADTELPASTDHNCEIVELEEHGFCLVAVRDIAAGEEFRIGMDY